MQSKIALLIPLVTGLCLHAQESTPQPRSSTLSGRLLQFNYGPDGKVDGVLLAPNTLVHLPPDWVGQVQFTARPGDQVTASGSVQQPTSGLQIMQPVRMNVGGKELGVIASTRPSVFSGSGVIQQMNYGPQGELNGFLLESGILARTTTFTREDAAVLKPGTTIGISGLASTGPAGRTIVDVQSINVNGRNIGMASDQGATPKGELVHRGSTPEPQPPVH